MKVGIIAPIKDLEKYCITDIQYCLPSLLLTSREYRDFYISKEEEDNLIILDCKKIGWKREPEDLEVVKKALEVIKPSIIISPSSMFNTKLSKKIYKEFLENIPSSYTVVRTIEGASVKDLVTNGDKVAIPSHMFRFLDKLPDNSVYIENHLNIEELEGRQGILVTSLPVRLGLQGRLLSDYRPTPPSLTFFEEKDKYSRVTIKNIEEIKEYYEL